MPAGSAIDRRRFLLGAAGGLMSVYGAGRLGLGGRALSEGIAQAATAQSASSPILVSIFLAGGIDALSVLAPTEDPTYRKLRPTLAVSPSDGIPFAEDPRLSWGPAAAGFAALHSAGKLTVFPGIGYRDPDMSHFTSRHYWEVGAADTRVMTGWLGRYLDQVGTAANPLQGLSMDSEMNPTLATAVNPVAAIDLPESFSLWLDDVWGDVFNLTLDSASAMGDAHRRAADPAIAQVAGAASEVGVVRRALAPFRNADGKPTYTTPGHLPDQQHVGLPSAAGRAGGDDRGRPAAAMRRPDAGDPVRHARHPERDVHPRADDDRRGDRRLPGRPRGPGDRRPRARARVVGVRAPGAGERREGDRPRRRGCWDAHRHPRRPARWWGSGHR